MIGDFGVGGEDLISILTILIWRLKIMGMRSAKKKPMTKKEREEKRRKRKEKRLKK